MRMHERQPFKHAQNGSSSSEYAARSVSAWFYELNMPVRLAHEVDYNHHQAE
jgi:hypothetical protein